MSIPINQLPADVLDALRRGDTIEAIKLLRQSTGLGLKEAKDVIDEHLQGHAVSIDSIAPQGMLPTSVLDAVHRGNKIEAIKLLRAHSGLGLKEAKDAVDAVQQQTNISTRGIPSGENPESTGVLLWLLPLIVAGIAGYFFLYGSG